MKWYRQRLDWPLFKGTLLTLRQHLYTMCMWKRDNNITDTAFEQFLIINQQTLPQPNLAPSSFYLVKQILGCKDLWEYEWHVCSCHQHAWPPLAPKLWKASLTCTCPKCQELRFEEDQTVTGKKFLKPKQVCLHGHRPLACNNFVALLGYNNFISLHPLKSHLGSRDLLP